MKLLLAVFILTMLSGCIMSKKVGVCLDYHKGGHGILKFGAGVWSGGDILEISMNGPATYIQVHKDATTHPCPHDGEPRE